MLKENLIDLYNFMLVADEASFTKAAVKLGVTQSAFSHSLKAFEKRMGSKLLERTTRKVGLTEVGKKLFDELYTHFTDIENSLNIAGTESSSLNSIIKLAAPEIAAHKLLWPVISVFLSNHTNVKIEVDIIDSTCQSFSDFDAVIEIGESIYKDRKTIQLSKEHKIVTVSSPVYINNHGEPKTPMEVNNHKTIGIVTPFQPQQMFWKFSQYGDEMVIENDFSLIFNTYSQLILAVKGHAGIAHLPQILVDLELVSGELKAILPDWCSSMPGFYIHYSASQPYNPILSQLINSLKNYAENKNL